MMQTITNLLSTSSNVDRSENDIPPTPVNSPTESSAFVKAMSSIPNTFTENGDLSFSSSGNELVDLFMKTCRGISPESIANFLVPAFKSDPKTTSQILAHLRDCNGKGEGGALGKGEKKAFYDALFWVRCNRPKDYVLWLTVLHEFGCFKDILQLAIMAQDGEKDTLVSTAFEMLQEGIPEIKGLNENVIVFSLDGSEEEYLELIVYASVLKEVESVFNQNKIDIRKLGSKPLSVKWAPSEKGGMDKSHGFAKRIAKLMYPYIPTSFMSSKYRKFLSPIREFLKITETLMCSQRWTDIQYAQVASRCMHNNGKNKGEKLSVFERHDPDGYGQFLKDLAEKKTKVCAKGVFPYELVKSYLEGMEFDQVIESQWDVHKQKVLDCGSFGDCISVVDVSGSMNGIPMHNAIALGLMVAECSEGPFKDLVITFSEDPKFHQIKGTTLKDRVNSIKIAEWGGSTNIEKTFDTILGKALEHKLKQEDMPNTLFIFSDMQFDQVSNGYGEPTELKVHETTWQNTVKKFKANNYEPPQIVFWNLRGDTVEFPTVIGEYGVKAMVSGFSTDLLRVFLSGKDLNPLSVLRESVSAYPVIVYE